MSVAAAVMTASQIVSLIGKGIALAEQAANGVSEAETIATLVKSIIAAQRDPTAAELAQIDAAESAAYAAVEAS